MDVLSYVAWSIVVDNMGDVFNVDTSGDDIGADQDVCVAVSERVESLFTLLLRLLSVDQSHAFAGPLEVLMQTINVSDQVDEHDDGRLRIFL